MMAMLQGDDPGVSVFDFSCRVRRVEEAMRRSEVQHDRDFKSWEVTLMQWCRQQALTRKITNDVITQARFGRPPCSPPAAEIGAMAADFEMG